MGHSGTHLLATGRFDLPPGVRRTLATRDHRLHHFLWHLIRNSWHEVAPADRIAFGQRHPRWVPAQPRVRVGPRGPELNPDCGEAFLYMHRRMLADVNAALAAEGAPAIVPWADIPDVTDPDYPVPGRRQAGPADDPKSDAALAELRQRAASVLQVDTLRQLPLARVGAYVEAAIHDVLHMRWAAEDPGPMDRFPRQVDPLDLAPVIDPALDDPAVDWLGHPYSSHVNRVFWALHGWVDTVITAWLRARNLTDVAWTDQWVGEMPSHAGPHHPTVAAVRPLGVDPARTGKQGLESVLASARQLIGGHATFAFSGRFDLPSLTP